MEMPLSLGEGRSSFSGRAHKVAPGAAPREGATRGAGSSLSLTLLGAGPDAHGVARRIEAIEDSSGLPRSCSRSAIAFSAPPGL